MKKIKKLSLYELNPRFFKDSTGNGVGDLSGLANKFDYFDYLGVDGVIIKDVVSSDVEGKLPKFTEVATDLGSLNDLKKVIEKAKKFKKGIFIELKIGSLSQNHQWVKRAVEDPTDEFEGIIEMHDNKTNQNLTYKRANINKTQQFYVVDEKTQEVPLNWRSENVINKFVDVIRFWKDLGVNGFVFKDFEYIADPEKQIPMNDLTLKELRKFYRAVKEINDNIIIVGKTNFLPMGSAHSYTQGKTQVFDYFMTTEVSLLGTGHDLLTDRIGKFRIKDIKNVLKTFATDPSNILSFGSERAGRIISRWGNDGQYSKESAKALGMALLLNKSSSSIYYGDEIGTPNIGLTHLDDFQDKTLDSRKKAALESKISEEEFMDAQVLQNSINARSLMAWNDMKNGGFSVAEKTVTPASIWYKEVNVQFQFSDEDSVLNFYKELNRFVTRSTYAKILERGSYKISSLINGVIQMSFEDGDKQLRVYINLTDSIKPILFNKKGKVVLSNYSHKNYVELPKKLDAYEGVVVYYKEPVIKKVVKPIKEEKTQEIEIDPIEEEISKEAESIIKEDIKEMEFEIDNNQIEEVVNHDENHEIIIEDTNEIEESIPVEETTEDLVDDIQEDSFDEVNVPEEESTETEELVLFEEDIKKVEEADDDKQDIISNVPEEDYDKEMLDGIIVEEAHEEIIVEETLTEDLTIDIQDMKEDMVSQDLNIPKKEEKDDLEELKEIAKIDREIERSYLDEKTKLTEDEVAKTTLIDDSVDLDELFAEEFKKKK